MQRRINCGFTGTGFTGYSATHNLITNKSETCAHKNVTFRKYLVSGDVARSAASPRLSVVLHTGGRATR